MTEAAVRLGMTQPAVSHTIRSLETAVGTAIFDRSVRPLALTLAGDLLSERAIRLLDEARRILPAVRMASRTQLESIRIGAPDSVSGLLSHRLAAMLQPRVKHIFLSSGSTAVHRASLIARQLSMIVTNEPMEEFRGFECHSLMYEPFIRILPLTHAELAGKSLAENCDALPLIRYGPRSNAGRQIERHLSRLRIEPPRTVDADRTRQLTSMVENGLGWAITTPLCLLEARPNLDRLIVAPLPSPHISRHLTLVSHRDELGELPAQIARAARRVLEEQCRPQLIAMMPWIEESMSVAPEQP